MKIAIIGLGKMGEAIAQGLSSLPDVELKATVSSEATAQKKRQKLNFEINCDNKSAAAWADFIILSIKPAIAENILAQIKGELSEKKILISVCAATTIDKLQVWAGPKGSKIVRCMPNLPSLIGQGMTIYSLAPTFPKGEIHVVEKILKSLGRVHLIEEKLMDAATAISGCGPAYFFIIIEAICDAGVKLGLSRKLALELAAQTMAGSAQMVLQTGVHPEALKDEVTTPGGITIEGVVALEEGHLRSTLMKAVFAAHEKGVQLKKC